MNDHSDDTIRHGDEEPTHRPDMGVGASTGEKIGVYTLVERIGVGGMGEVWKAEQTEPIRRTVALKLIKAGMDSREVLARFEAERQALALMDHPCIAKVYDAGATALGRPYFAMEFVKGLSIVEYCDRRRLNTQERLALFQQVCYGVQHAHQKAVLHRDLKPSNILVSDIDGRPMPKIIDFGVAKATARKLSGDTMHTTIGQLIGTPEYMSPEQAEPTTEDVDTRTDVYSLGVILYELLVGCLPFDAQQLKRAGLEGILRVLREQEPARPSTRLTTMADQGTLAAKTRRTQPRRLVHQVRGDLDWIVLRALEKDRNRRYASPSEFAQDIQRHLDDEPVAAGPPAVGYRASKFVRRHRAGVSIASVAVVALVAFAFFASYQARRIASERDRATAEAAKSEAMNTFLTDMLAKADPWAGLGPDVTVVDALDAAGQEIDTAFEGHPEIEATMRGVLGKTYLGLGKLPPARSQIERAIQMRKENGETDDHELGALLTMQSKLEQDSANYDRAVQSAKEAARIFSSDPQATFEDRVYAHQDVVRNFLYGQHYARAESVLAICDELCSTQQGQRTLAAAENFGLKATLAAERDANIAAAESLSRRAYELAKSIAPDNPILGVYMNNVAQYRAQTGDYDGALTDFDTALALDERVVGTDHPQYATCLENRGGVLYRLNRPEETLAALQKVRDIRERNLGPDHIDVLRTTINMGTVASMAGHPDQAIGTFQELLPRLVEARGTDHPDVLAVLRNMAVALNALNRHEEAEQTLDRGIKTALRMYEPDDPRVAQFRAERGVVRLKRKNYTEAEKDLMQAYEAEVASLGADHPTTRSSASWLATLYDETARATEAEKYRKLAGK